MGQSKLPMQKQARNACPKCGGTSHDCYHVERFSSTYIVRYFQCRDCGQRFKTDESIDG